MKAFRFVRDIIGKAVDVRRLLVLIHDTFAAVLAWVGAFWLRFNLTVPEDVLAHMLYVGVPVCTISNASWVQSRSRALAFRSSSFYSVFNLSFHAPYY